MKLPNDYIVIDFETGGFLSSPNGRPIETGMLMFKDGRARIKTVLTDPRKDGHLDFIVEDGAYRAHGIGLDLLEKAGVGVKEGLSEVRRLIGDDMPLVAHNGVGFDEPLLTRELEKAGLPAIDPDRWFDTAALYKGWKLGEPLFDDETFQVYARRILNTRVRGLLFNIGFLLCTMPLGMWLVGPNGKKITDTNEQDYAVGIGMDPDLGFTDAELDLLMDLGLHRAPFDCAATHAVMHWAVNETENFFVED